VAAGGSAPVTWLPLRVKSLVKMVQGLISPKNLSGPITIAKVASTSAKSGLESYIGFLALLSVSLGVLNLLPIPVLDGGHLLYYSIELVARRPVPERVQMVGYQVGLALVISLMAFALYNDLRAPVLRRRIQAAHKRRGMAACACACACAGCAAMRHTW
jgi:regulator of sigma E protease